jgi:hypothetical protein
MDVKTLTDYYPNFIWVLRDVSSEKQYKQNHLDQMLSDSFDDKRTDFREIIKSNFKKRDFFVLSTPIQDENIIKNLDNEPISHLRSEFLYKNAKIGYSLKSWLVM